MAVSVIVMVAASEERENWPAKSKVETRHAYQERKLRHDEGANGSSRLSSLVRMR